MNRKIKFTILAMCFGFIFAGSSLFSAGFGNEVDITDIKTQAVEGVKAGQLSYEELNKMLPNYNIVLGPKDLNMKTFRKTLKSQYGEGEIVIHFFNGFIVAILPGVKLVNGNPTLIPDKDKRIIATSFPEKIKDGLILWKKDGKNQYISATAYIENMPGCAEYTYNWKIKFFTNKERKNIFIDTHYEFKKDPHACALIEKSNSKLDIGYENILKQPNENLYCRLSSLYLIEFEKPRAEKIYLESITWHTENASMLIKWSKEKVSGFTIGYTNKLSPKPVEIIESFRTVVETNDKCILVNKDLTKVAILSEDAEKYKLELYIAENKERINIGRDFVSK